ncbi:VCBS repeat-containing protein [Streptomyces sp. NBC_01255]|uniref:FG-GAP repeat domain-containing protein n=1 Tax=Streptomyces sp. NBC_01255 TaxID=2903798 RepID=UPI002E2EC182|nr:VCBS repeat-containing protein [Streptomyces sp. NBC_01255]
MSHTGSSRRHLTAAVAVALAAACAGTFTTGVALATTETTTAVSSGTAQESAAALLPNSYVTGNGPTGFLSVRWAAPSGGQSEYRWTRYQGGVTTLLPAGTYEGSAGSDVIVKKVNGTTYNLYDMATGVAPVVIDTTSVGATARLVRAEGSTLVMEVPRAGGGSDVHLVGKAADGTLLNRKVAGVPDTTSVRSYFPVAPGELLVRYWDSAQSVLRALLVDVATAKVTENRVLTESIASPDVTASATHVVWSEYASDTTTALWLAKRGQEGATRVPVGSNATLALGVLGDDWVAYGDPRGFATARPNPLHALTVRSLTDGRTVKLLDLVHRVVPTGDGTLLVQGSTLAQGEGLYRLTVGADGEPAAILVASTGRPLVYTVTGVTVPATVDFSVARNGVPLKWQGSGSSVGKVTLELTHTATGARATLGATTQGAVSLNWGGTFDNGTAVHNGDYTWRLTTVPYNGIGEKAELTGSFKVIGRPADHDFSNSTSPDLLFRSGGRLSVFDARQFLDSNTTDPLSEVVVGSGWDTYDRIVTPGNLGGTVHADLLGRDKSGVLWSYAGTGIPSVPFKTRTRVGGGWGIYNKITAGLDVSGDGRRDLLATDKDGALWLYKGTGSITSPFRPRVRVGGGWGIYNKITATGNIGGGPAGDLIARDKDGVDWLYLGKGDGTFAARTRISSDWGYYTDLIAVGDADRDGRSDLVVRHVTGGDTGSLLFYPGSGDWRNPFPKEVSIDSSRRFVRDGTLMF